MAEKRGQQARGVRAEMLAGSRRAKDDGPVGEDIRTALGTWPLEEGIQPVEYRKRVLDSDDDEEIRALPEEEQGIARPTKVLRRYVPIQAVVKRPAAAEESNVAIRAWLGAIEGAAKAPDVGKSKRGCVRGKGAPAVAKGSKKKWVKRSGQGSLAGWVVRTPKDGVGAQGKREEGDLRDAHSPGVLEGGERGSEREQRGAQATQESMVSWGTGDVGPVQPGYESGDTNAMLNAFERDTHRALADWVGDRNSGQAGLDKACMQCCLDSGAIRHLRQTELAGYYSDRGARKGLLQLWSKECRDTLTLPALGDWRRSDQSLQRQI